MPLSLWTPLPASVVPRLPLSPHRVPRIPRVPRLQRGLRGATAAAAVSATWSLAQRRGAQGGEALLQALQRNGFVTVELSGAEEKVLGEAEMVDGELGEGAGGNRPLQFIDVSPTFIELLFSCGRGFETRRVGDIKQCL